MSWDGGAYAVSTGMCQALAVAFDRLPDANARVDRSPIGLPGIAEFQHLTTTILCSFSLHPARSQAMTKIARGICVAVLSTLSLLSIPSLALAQSRFEQTSPSVTSSAGWSLDSSRSWSGGTAGVSTTPGARATFTFSGHSVSWIGGRAPVTGIARVSVDGVFLTEVDTYSKTEEIRVPMFTVNGLANTTHTLTIEVTGRQNAAATSDIIVVDAFDVPGPAVSRLQETDPDISYTAGWTQDNALYANSGGLLTGLTQGVSLRNWSAGTAMFSTTPDAQATFTFTGTGVGWIGARGNQTGIARVFLDGAFITEVDTYS